MGKTRDFFKKIRDTKGTFHAKMGSMRESFKKLKLNGSMKTWDLLELTPKKDVLFIIWDWNAKVGSQETPGVTGKFGVGVQNEAGQKLIEFCQKHTGHRKHPLPTTYEKTLHMDITRWLTLKSDWLYSLQPKMQKLYTVSKNKTGSWLWLRSWIPSYQIQTQIEESRENH